MSNQIVFDTRLDRLQYFDKSSFNFNSNSNSNSNSN